MGADGFREDDAEAADNVDWKLSWRCTLPLAVDAADAIDAIEDCIWKSQVAREADSQSLGTWQREPAYAMLNISKAAQRVTWACTGMLCCTHWRWEGK